MEEQIDLCEVQHKAQAQETKAVKEALTEASMELEVIGDIINCTMSEKKRMQKAYL